MPVKTKVRKSTTKDDSAEKAAAVEKEAIRAAKAAEKAAEKEAAKAEREAAKEKARLEKEAQAAKEYQDAIDSGDLIVVGDVEYRKIDRSAGRDKLGERAGEVIEILKASKTPVSGKALADRFGGGTVQWVAYFAILRQLGLVEVYRSRTGERGQSTQCYLWIG